MIIILTLGASWWVADISFQYFGLNCDLFSLRGKHHFLTARQGSQIIANLLRRRLLQVSKNYHRQLFVREIGQICIEALDPSAVMDHLSPIGHMHHKVDSTLLFPGKSRIAWAGVGNMPEFSRAASRKEVHNRVSQ